MSREELITLTAKDAGVTKKVAESVIDAVVFEITSALANDERVILPNFITFETGVMEERRARNPRTGEIVTFPKVRTIRCKVSRKLKDIVNDNEV